MSTMFNAVNLADDLSKQIGPASGRYFYQTVDHGEHQTRFATGTWVESAAEMLAMDVSYQCQLKNIQS